VSILSDFRNKIHHIINVFVRVGKYDPYIEIPDNGDGTFYILGNYNW
jgi:hypothetical protein